MKNPVFYSALFSVLTIAATSLADTVVLDAARDNTIYSDFLTNSNGSGDFFFTGQNGGGNPRRGLISFDFSAIPSNATIDSVTLTMFVSQAGSGVATDVNLHRVTSDWGESTSDAPGGEGGGGAAAAGDATWEFAFFNEQAWTNPGGDFVGQSSATTVVDTTGSFSWSSPSLVSDVQDWIDGINSNFGWILIGDETDVSTSKRFNSRTNANNNPSLTVEFTVIPEPASAAILMFGFAGLAIRRTR